HPRRRLRAPDGARTRPRSGRGRARALPRLGLAGIARRQGAVLDLLGLLVPLRAVADLRARPPAQALRLRLHPLPEPRETLVEQRPALRPERRVREALARGLDRLPARAPEAPVAGEQLGDVRGVDRVVVVLRDVVRVEDGPDVE